MFRSHVMPVNATKVLRLFLNMIDSPCRFFVNAQPAKAIRAKHCCASICGVVTGKQCWFGFLK